MEWRRNLQINPATILGVFFLSIILSSCSIAEKLDSNHVYYHPETPDVTVNEKKTHGEVAEVQPRKIRNSTSELEWKESDQPAFAKSLDKVPEINLDFTKDAEPALAGNPQLTNKEINHLMAKLMKTSGNSTMSLFDVQDLTLVELILAIILPPLAVALEYGLETEFWIALILTILGWIPGVIYAIIVLADQ